MGSDERTEEAMSEEKAIKDLLETEMDMAIVEVTTKLGIYSNRDFHSMPNGSIVFTVDEEAKHGARFIIMIPRHAIESIKLRVEP